MVAFDALIFLVKLVYRVVAAAEERRGVENMWSDVGLDQPCISHYPIGQFYVEILKWQSLPLVMIKTNKVTVKVAFKEF